MTTLEDRLIDAGIARRDAEIARRRTAQTLHEVVREAAKADWSKTKIAVVSGLSRQTVHEILKDIR